jgi:hypothetical protein
MKIYTHIILWFVTGFFSSLKAGDYQPIDSKMQTEEFTDLDGKKSMFVWEFFETKIYDGDQVLEFSIFERRGAEFAKGKIDLKSGKYSLSRHLGEITKKDYKVEIITVREDGSKIIRLRFNFGILPKRSTLHIKAI